ncbi:hypothetical protein ALC53_04102 [Atta colombica]|uniref:Uncharacterized protein n=1 Tax=Atta colombica TaxID=520822 RepID=A0A195BL58_9HYME|nr:hypothetical protein ALC53_04102 [Atta colombica]
MSKAGSFTVLPYAMTKDNGWAMRIRTDSTGCKVASSILNGDSLKVVTRSETKQREARRTRPERQEEVLGERKIKVRWEKILVMVVDRCMGNGKRRENRAGILVSVSVEENEIVVDNLDAARSHTYLSVTCVHGECTDDPYAWCNDGTARSRGGLSQKGLENVQTLRGVGGLFFTSTKREGLANTTKAKAAPDTSESAKVVRQRREAHRQRKEDSPQQPHRWQLSLSGGCTSTSKSSSNSSTTSTISSSSSSNSSSSSSSSSSGGGGNLPPKAQNVAHAHPGIEPAEAQRHRRTSRQVSQYVWRTVRERTYTFLIHIRLSMVFATDPIRQMKRTLMRRGMEREDHLALWVPYVSTMETRNDTIR